MKKNISFLSSLFPDQNLFIKQERPRINITRHTDHGSVRIPHVSFVIIPVLLIIQYWGELSQVTHGLEDGVRWLLFQEANQVAYGLGAGARSGGS